MSPLGLSSNISTFSSGLQISPITMDMSTTESSSSLSTPSPLDPSKIIDRVSSFATNLMNTKNLTWSKINHETENGHLMSIDNETNPALADLNIYDDTSQTWFSSDKITLSAFYFTLAITAIASNFIVCFIVLGSQRMRTPTNYFILNMAVGDIMMAFLCIPFTVLANFIFQYWPFGLPLCRLVSYAQALSVFTSAYTLVAISIDKYFAIIYPMRLRMSKKQAKIIILVIWLAALITSLPIAMLSQLENDSGQANSATRPHQGTLTPSSQSAPSANLPTLTNQQSRKRSIKDAPTWLAHPLTYTLASIADLLVDTNTNIDPTDRNYNINVRIEAQRGTASHGALDLYSDDVVSGHQDIQNSSSNQDFRVHDNHNAQNEDAKTNISSTATTNNYDNNNNIRYSKHSPEKTTISAVNEKENDGKIKSHESNSMDMTAQYPIYAHLMTDPMIDPISKVPVGTDGSSQHHHDQPPQSVSYTSPTSTILDTTAENDKLYCHENWSFWPQGRYYYSTTLMILQFVIPLFVLVITYSRIVIIVWGKKIPGEEDDARDARMARSKRKMIKMVIFCVIAYALAWLPLNLVIIIGDFYPDMYAFPYTEKIFMFCHFLAMCHTITNPIIYIWMNNRFRAGFKKTLLVLLRFIVRSIAYISCYLCLFGCFLTCSRKNYASLVGRYDRSGAGRAYENAYHTGYIGRSGSIVRQTLVASGPTSNVNAKTSNSHNMNNIKPHHQQSNQANKQQNNHVINFGETRDDVVSTSGSTRRFDCQARRSIIDEDRQVDLSVRNDFNRIKHGTGAMNKTTSLINTNGLMSEQEAVASDRADLCGDAGGASARSISPSQKSAEVCASSSLVVVVANDDNPDMLQSRANGAFILGK